MKSAALRGEGPPSAAPSALSGIDVEAFSQELQALRAEVEASHGPEDLAHLRRVERWGRLCTALGYATAWLAPNPLSALLMAQGSTARWTMMAHHVTHRGYDRVPGVEGRYTSGRFATGGRRLVDWLEWIHPEAWRHEHNVLHHGRTGEVADPDLVEHNTEWLRRSRLPLVARYALVAFFACTWKLTYYAPNTFQEWRRERRRREGVAGEVGTGRLLTTFNPLSAEGRAFWWQCLLPYAGVRFVLLPALFAPLGAWAALSVLANSVLAEVLGNIQTFVLIAPNHAGEDVYRFEGRAEGHGQFALRQVVGSVNYRTGGDVVDFLHGYLNYQIEHHLWPSLPMRSYQRLQPRVKALCEKHGVPYVQEGVFRRVGKLVDIMVGRASMKRA